MWFTESLKKIKTKILFKEINHEYFGGSDYKKYQIFIWYNNSFKNITWNHREIENKNATSLNFLTPFLLEFQGKRQKGANRKQSYDFWSYGIPRQVTDGQLLLVHEIPLLWDSLTKMVLNKHQVSNKREITYLNQKQVPVLDQLYYEYLNPDEVSHQLVILYEVFPPDWLTNLVNYEDAST